MRYLMLICRDDQPVEAPTAPAGGDVEEWVRTMDGRGVRITGDPLSPPSAAVAVRVRGGEVKRSNGTYLDDRELLLGFDLLECRDLAEATEVAAAHPLARRFVLELRPIESD